MLMTSNVLAVPVLPSRFYCLMQQLTAILCNTAAPAAAAEAVGVK